MPAKQFQFRAEARQSILRGANILADAVRVTLGPKSKCVLIEKKFGRPIVCDDGVTIAKEVELKDPEENLGAQMIREAAERTGEAVGDGTTTATLTGARHSHRRSSQRRGGRERGGLEARTDARSQGGCRFHPGFIPSRYQ
jgi:chaperonin GroEL (HSP60 family)